MRGDKEASAKRREKAILLPELPGSAKADALGDMLVARKLVPETKKVDAYHLALAAFHRADYLLTWNQKHLDNLDLRARIEKLIKDQGFKPAKIITPERLMDGGNDVKKSYADMEPLEEVRAIREEISREFKSLRELGEYLRKNPPIKAGLESPRNGRRVAAKAGKRPASRRRKAAVHA